MGEVLAVKSVILALIAAIALTACGSDKSATGNFTDIRNVLTPKFGKSAAVAAPPITRDAVRQLGVPLMQGTVLARDTVGYMGVLDTKGDIVTWQTTGRDGVVLQRGVVLQSRGLGDDLMSARAPSAGQIAQGSGTFQRQYFYLNGADQEIRWDYACTFAPSGNETVAIVGLAYATQKVTETCQGAQGVITNQYWFESGGNLRQSVQWISKGVGYMKLQSLIE